MINIYNPMLLIRSVISGDNPAVPLRDDGTVDEAINDGTLIPNWKSKISNSLATVERCANSVCRIRMQRNGASSYGTAFVVGDGLLVTNRHVVEDYYDENMSLHSGVGCSINFAVDGNNTSPANVFEVTDKAVKIGHNFQFFGDFNLDVAIIRVPQTATAGRSHLKFNLSPTNSSQVVAIGYPSEKQSSSAIENKIFPLGFKVVKRASPGEFSYSGTKTGQAMHTGSTLKGSSGSPVIDSLTGEVIGVHFFSELESGPITGNGTAFGPRLGEFLAACVSLLAATGQEDFLAAGVKLSQKKSRDASLNAASSLGVLPDPPDFRDYEYQPGLRRLSNSLTLPYKWPSRILNQGETTRCTGFALAHAVAILNRTTVRGHWPSARMAYEMARIHDEMPGRNTEGSTLRGVIKGFHHNGLSKEREGEAELKDWVYNINMAEEARSLTLGSYYRLASRITDYQAALAEAEVVLVAARVHQGWIKPRIGRIQYRGTADQTMLAHAFVIVGYDDKGFIILNSAGPNWSSWKRGKGRAHWSYDDWADNILDGWVLRPAVRAPSAFGKIAKTVFSSSISGAQPNSVYAPRRRDILGHAITVEAGKLLDFGRYASNGKTLEETKKYLESEKAQKKYQHLLLFFHSEITTEEEGMRWLTAVKPYFKSNGIYPLSILIEPSHAVAFRQLLDGAKKEAGKRLQSTAAAYPDLVLKNLDTFGRKLLRSFDNGIKTAFKDGSDLSVVLSQLLGVSGLNLHIAGHFRGCVAVPFAKMIADKVNQRLVSCQLIAPTIGQNAYWAVYQNRSAAERCKATQPMNYCVGKQHRESLWTISDRYGWLDINQAWLADSEGQVVGRLSVADTFVSPAGELTSDVSEIVADDIAPENLPGEPSMINALMKVILGGGPPKNAIPKDAFRSLRFLQDGDNLDEKTQ